jgi:hypothetical protein
MACQTEPLTGPFQTTDRPAPGDWTALRRDDDTGKKCWAPFSEAIESESYYHSYTSLHTTCKRK